MNEFIRSIIPLSQQKKPFTAHTKRDQYKNEAKSSKNILKIAMVLHVLWHHIDNLLQYNWKTDPTPTKISCGVMNLAISLNGCSSNFKGIIQAVSIIIYVQLSLLFVHKMRERWSCGQGSYYYFLRFFKAEYDR